MDPNPEVVQHKTLLGIRFDNPSRHGSFHTPYYILLKRVSSSNKAVRVHRHTIPALVPLQRYEEQYLPQPDVDTEEDETPNGTSTEHPTTTTETTTDTSNKQDLHSLVAKVRHDLISWHLRRDTLDQVCEELNLPAATPLSPSVAIKADPDSKTEAIPDPNPNPDAEDNNSSSSIMPAKHSHSPRKPKHNLTSLTLVSNDASQVRLIWANDTVGRIKFSETGVVMKAVVIGSGGQIKEYENILCSTYETSGMMSSVRTVVGGGASSGGRRVTITDLPERLKVMEQFRKRMERKTRVADEVESEEEGDDDDDEEQEQDETSIADEDDGDTTMQT